MNKTVGEAGTSAMGRRVPFQGEISTRGTGFPAFNSGWEIAVENKKAALPEWKGGLLVNGRQVFW
ncbi:hypothetical protein [Streptomyces guryensis]|uniref:Uncharacterized protein n=1 Tax=Streptomyces guryensis TaxID=2886947 RepID=A0A9Q3ZB38_9ACTN|nr:hypothetical protein [Streptomyces guryensis]MCD9878217.1 hypothetical protein [Streptomyces guryensis]